MSMEKKIASKINMLERKKFYRMKSVSNVYCIYMKKDVQYIHILHSYL